MTPHSQLIAYGYSAVAKQVADATGAETDMLPSSKLSEYLYYGKEQGKYGRIFSL
jgi:cleavage stimulation factor subunit 1